MKKDFTKAQKGLLERKVIAKNIADSQLQEFINFLKEEHEVDETWMIAQDLSGFTKPDKEQEPASSLVPIPE